MFKCLVYIPFIVGYRSYSTSTKSQENAPACYGTAYDTRYASRVAFLSLFDIAQQIVYPPRLPLYRFSRSRVPIKLSSNPLKSLQQLYIAINSTNLMLIYLAFAYNTSSS